MFLVYGTWDPLRWPLPLGHDSNRTVPSAVATVKRTGEYRLRLLFWAGTRNDRLTPEPGTIVPMNQTPLLAAGPACGEFAQIG